jgi:hypothetical protein
MELGGGAPTWSDLRQAPAVILHRPHLTRTVTVALVVGTMLFAINQLDVVMAGEATARTWIKVATTYLVPFFVANYGVLTATRRRAGPAGRRP